MQCVKNVLIVIASSPLIEVKKNAPLGAFFRSAVIYLPY